MSLKKLVDATMKHGSAALAETSGGETNAYALSWWTKNLGYSRNAINERTIKRGEQHPANTWHNSKTGKREPYTDDQHASLAAIDRSQGGDQYDADYMTGYQSRDDAEQYIAQQDAEHLDKRDPSEIEMQFNFDENDGDTDWDERSEPELDRQTNYDAPPYHDGDDSYDLDEAGGMSDEEGDYHHEVRKDKRLDQETDFGRHPPSGTERGRQYQQQLAKDQKRNKSVDEDGSSDDPRSSDYANQQGGYGAWAPDEVAGWYDDEGNRKGIDDLDESGGNGRMVFGPNYNPRMKSTDLSPNAPSVPDYVMTRDGSGRGIVVDSWQNNDGYYVFFTVELIDGELDGVKKDYHISALKKIPKNEMHPTGVDEADGDVDFGSEGDEGTGYEDETYDKEQWAEYDRKRADRESRILAANRKKDANESIRVNHPLHGNGIVEAITTSHIQITWDNLEKRLSVSNTIPFAEAKYLTRLKEEYTDDVEDARVGNAKTNLKRVKKGIDKDMKKNQKVDESLVAMGMAPIGGTHRGTTKLTYVEDDIIRFDDLLEDGDEWKQPWNEEEGEDTDDSAEGGEGSENRKPDQNTTKGADYTNVPRPADSVLTNQDNQQSYSADPLSTKAGYESAGDGSEPDGDYQDINPVDAPETPQIRDLEGSSDRGNTRDTGGDSDDSEVDAGDYDESKPEDNDGGENKMKNESTSAWLSADDLGINLMESDQGFGSYDDDDGGMNEHEMGSGEIAFTSEFLGKLVAAISAQAPDQAMMDALCAGLASAQSEKGDSGLDVSDWDAVKSAASAAYGGGGDDMGGDDMGGDEGYDDEAGDPVGDEGGEDEFGDEESDYEDQAVGDGEVAGAEGGEEHEGKTKMMDCDGDMNEKKVDVDGNRPGRRNKGQRQGQSMKRRAPKKSQQLEGEGSGTPIGTGSSSGSGGGNQKDLSKPKSYKGKPVGTGTSGAGGSNANEFGQKPTKDGGANNLPEYESGNQLGADSTPFGSDAESPAPRSSKPLAAEGKKNSRKKIDEAICLGMSSIPGVIRGDYADVPDDADWDDELKLIKRRAGLENWWKD